MFNVVFTILMLLISRTFPLEFELEVDNEWVFDNSIISGSDGNPLKYSFFNLFDNNTNTTLAINTNVREIKGYAYFDIILKKNYLVDKIVIYNGFQKSINSFYKNSRVKELEIWVTKVLNQEHKNFTNLLKTNILLKDTSERQVVNLPYVLDGNEFGFYVQSTYPGTQYDDICISEIEFWYKGEKYKVKNLEEAKREYIKMRRKEMIFETEYLKMAHEGVILEDIDTVKDRFKTLGIDVNKIHLGRWTNTLDGGIKKEITTYYIQFSYSTETNGGIFFARRDLKKKIKDWREIINPVKVGEWKIDEYGNIWIKIGKGRWKMSKNGFKFDGTDLGPGSWLSQMG